MVGAGETGGFAEEGADAEGTDGIEDGAGEGPGFVETEEVAGEGAGDAVAVGEAQGCVAEILQHGAVF